MSEPFFVYRNKATKKIVVKTLGEARVFQGVSQWWITWDHIATIDSQSFIQSLLNAQPELINGYGQ